MSNLFFAAMDKVIADSAGRIERMGQQCRAVGNHLDAQQVRALLDYDASTGVFTWRTGMGSRSGPAKRAGTVDSKGYVCLRIRGERQRAHRLAWLYVHGVWPVEIDHINRDKTDNRIANLREVTRCENMQNAATGPKSRTGVRGVAHHPVTGKFAAYISRNNIKTWLGVFDTIEEAAAARRRAEQEMPS